MSARLVIHVQPRSRVSEVAGRHGDAIKIRLTAPPVNGAANDELVRFLAERLAVSRAAVRLTAGAAARRKIVVVEGITLAEAERRLLRTAGSRRE